MAEPSPSFRIAGEQGRQALERVRARLADRMARGILEREEVERVSAKRLHTFDGDEAASEIFRRCCVTWEVDRTPPITSHRAVLGPVLVAVKRAVRRVLRYQTEAQLSRQRDFNWNLLLVLRELLERERHES
jgi:uncharacterized small protein (DUF1192 family)